MSIFLGNLTVNEIERRTGITLSEEDKQFMEENHQGRVNDYPLEAGKWHCFDIPFMLMTHNKETADEYIKMLSSYDWSGCREALKIGWES